MFMNRLILKRLPNLNTFLWRGFASANRRRRTNLSTLEEKEITEQNWELRCQLATAYRAFERWVI